MMVLTSFRKVTKPSAWRKEIVMPWHMKPDIWWNMKLKLHMKIDSEICLVIFYGFDPMG